MPKKKPATKPRKRPTKAAKPRRRAAASPKPARARKAPQRAARAPKVPARFRALGGVDPRTLPPGTPYPCSDGYVGAVVRGDKLAGRIVACATPPVGSRGQHFVLGKVASGRAISGEFRKGYKVAEKAAAVQRERARRDSIRTPIDVYETPWQPSRPRATNASDDLRRSAVEASRAHASRSRAVGRVVDDRNDPVPPPFHVPRSERRYLLSGRPLAAMIMGRFRSSINSTDKSHIDAVHELMERLGIRGGLEQLDYLISQNPHDFILSQAPVAGDRILKRATGKSRDEWLSIMS